MASTRKTMDILEAARIAVVNPVKQDTRHRAIVAFMEYNGHLCQENVDPHTGTEHAVCISQPLLHSRAFGELPSFETMQVRHLQQLAQFNRALPVRIVCYTGLFLFKPMGQHKKPEPVMLMQQSPPLGTEDRNVRNYKLVTWADLQVSVPHSTQILWICASPASDDDAMNAFLKKLRMPFMEAIVTRTINCGAEVAMDLHTRSWLLSQLAVDKEHYESAGSVLRRLLAVTLPDGVSAKQLQPPFLVRHELPGVRGLTSPLSKVDGTFPWDVDVLLDGSHVWIDTDLSDSKSAEPVLPTLHMKPALYKTMCQTALNMARLLETDRLQGLWFCDDDYTTLRFFLSLMACAATTGTFSMTNLSKVGKAMPYDARSSVVFVVMSKSRSPLLSKPSIEHMCSFLHRSNDSIKFVPVFCGWRRRANFRWAHAAMQAFDYDAVLHAFPIHTQLQGGVLQLESYDMDNTTLLMLAHKSSPRRRPSKSWTLVHPYTAMHLESVNRALRNADDTTHRVVLRHSAEDKGVRVKMHWFRPGQNTSCTRLLHLSYQGDCGRPLWYSASDTGKTRDGKPTVLVGAVGFEDIRVHVENLVNHSALNGATMQRPIQILLPTLSVMLSMQRCRLFFGGVIPPPIAHNGDWFLRNQTRFTGSLLLDTMQQGASDHALLVLKPLVMRHHSSNADSPPLEEPRLLRERDNAATTTVAPYSMPVSILPTSWMQPVSIPGRQLVEMDYKLLSVLRFIRLPLADDCDSTGNAVQYLTWFKVCTMA